MARCVGGWQPSHEATVIVLSHCFVWNQLETLLEEEIVIVAVCMCVSSRTFETMRDVTLYNTICKPEVVTHVLWVCKHNPQSANVYVLAFIIYLLVYTVCAHNALEVSVYACSQLSVCVIAVVGLFCLCYQHWQYNPLRLHLHSPDKPIQLKINDTCLFAKLEFWLLTLVKFESL